MTYYVNMVDTFMSGWGYAKHGKSRFCVKCDTLPEARIIEAAARARPEMKYVTIANRPALKHHGDHVRIIHYDELGSTWKEYKS